MLYLLYVATTFANQVLLPPPAAVLACSQPQPHCSAICQRLVSTAALAPPSRVPAADATANPACRRRIRQRRCRQLRCILGGRVQPGQQLLTFSHPLPVCGNSSSAAAASCAAFIGAAPSPGGIRQGGSCSHPLIHSPPAATSAAPPPPAAPRFWQPRPARAACAQRRRWTGPQAPTGTRSRRPPAGGA